MPKASAAPAAPAPARPSLKRFAEGLTPGARRSRARFPHDAAASYAPTSAALCRACGARIERGLARVALFLQCHKGYKDASLTHYVHVACLGAHPEAHKLAGVGEVAGAAALAPADAARLALELQRAATRAVPRSAAHHAPSSSASSPLASIQAPASAPAAASASSSASASATATAPAQKAVRRRANRKAAAAAAR